METRYNPVTQSVYPTSLPHARTGERERERERELSDLSQSGSGKAGIGTGEEDTAPRLSHPSPSPSTTSTLPHSGTVRDISCPPLGVRVTAVIKLLLEVSKVDYSFLCQ